MTAPDYSDLLARSALEVELIQELRDALAHCLQTIIDTDNGYQRLVERNVKLVDQAAAAEGVIKELRGEIEAHQERAQSLMAAEEDVRKQNKALRGRIASIESSWIRALDGKVLRKSHLIDGLVLTTRELVKRSHRLETVEGYLLHAETIAEYGPYVDRKPW